MNEIYFDHEKLKVYQKSVVFVAWVNKFDISRGSAFESASTLDLLFSKNLVTVENLKEGKEQLREIVSMLMGLIKSNSDRVYESEDNYS